MSNQTISVAGALAAALIATTGSAEARCKGFQDEVRAVSRLVSAGCGVAGQQYACRFAHKAAGQAPASAVQHWNAISNNGPAAIGPRSIAYGARDHGKLIAPAGRLWIAEEAVNGSVSVRVKHTSDDKSKAMVDLCAVDAQGNVRYINYVSFPKKSKRGAVRTRNVRLNNEVLFVDMKANTLARSFTYNIRLTKN